MNMANAPLAIITGASSGIGLELALLFAADGYELLLSARASDRFTAATERVRSIAKAPVQTHADDLVDPQSATRFIAALGGRVPDVLVNNAGFGTHGLFAETDPQSQLDMIAVNISALVQLTRLVLPGMIARGSGRILNVSSVAGFQSGPYMATYYASKAFVTSFSRAINYELRRSGITVTALCPGPTTTEFQARAGIADAPLFRNNTMSASAVARIGYDAMLAGKPVVISGFKNKLLAIGAKFAPAVYSTRVAGRLNADR
ncbi:MAG: SDR family oxidoreductase [Phycisphaerae bacterium]|nr:SDR family oxidoreductase [Phycisphaerae bacterium]